MPVCGSGNPGYTAGVAAPLGRGSADCDDEKFGVWWSCVGDVTPSKLAMVLTVLSPGDPSVATCGSGNPGCFTVLTYGGGIVEGGEVGGGVRAILIDASSRCERDRFPLRRRPKGPTTPGTERFACLTDCLQGLSPRYPARMVHAKSMIQ